MNDQTTELIEKLASKLGTTSEYLWGVLINQASISAVLSIIVIVATVVFGMVLFRLHKKFCKKDEHKESIYDEFEDVAGIPMVIGLLFLIIMSIVSLCEISNMVTGFFNSEYWALKQVMDLI